MSSAIESRLFYRHVLGCSSGIILGLLSFGLSAQDYSADPLYGSIDLASGYLPDPFVVEVQAGGNLDIGQQFNDCLGYIEESQPDFRLHYETGDYTLSILTDSEVDTTLLVNAPNGDWYCNDDAESSSGTNAGLLFDSALEGQYDIWVGTYEANDTGATARLLISEYAQQQWLSLMEESRSGSNTFNIADTTPSVDVDSQYSGVLDNSDPAYSSGSYFDLYHVEGSRGEVIDIELNSNQFDTVLSIEGFGLSETNDDFGDATNSRLQIQLPESGTYSLSVSSYDSGETGSYQLSLANGSQLNDTSSASQSFSFNSDGNLHGIFIGVADYPGTGSDLALTDQDAIRARDALVNGAGMNSSNAVTLINEDATIANVTNALLSAADELGPEDTLVVFFSGHGSRENRLEANSSDPDGVDETMYLYDGHMLDDSFANLLDQGNAGKVLLIMDSCFSGGFSKDVVSQPGRMGIFSSEEDVTSLVALEFQAGGYLSVFFEEAIGQQLADIDRDDEITALELSQYLHGRFRNDVKSVSADDFVSSPTASYQHLVVDRGGISAHEVLFTF